MGGERPQNESSMAMCDYFLLLLFLKQLLFRIRRSVIRTNYLQLIMTGHTNNRNRLGFDGNEVYPMLGEQYNTHRGTAVTVRCRPVK
jgi:hypothetical protein